MPSTVNHTYESLLAQVRRDMEEPDNDELEANFQQIVARAESRLYTDLNLEIFDRVRTGQLTPGQFVQAIKPTTWQATKTFWIRADDSGAATGRRIYLLKRSYEYCMEYAPDEAATDQPRQFAEYSDTEYFISPAPDALYHYEIREISQTAALALTDVNDTTWLSANAGDLFVAVANIEAARFLQGLPADIETLEKTYAALFVPRQATLRDLIRQDYSPVQNAPRTTTDNG